MRMNDKVLNSYIQSGSQKTMELENDIIAILKCF